MQSTTNENFIQIERFLALCKLGSIAIYGILSVSGSASLSNDKTERVFKKLPQPKQFVKKCLRISAHFQTFGPSALHHSRTRSSQREHHRCPQTATGRLCTTGYAEAECGNKAATQSAGMRTSEACEKC